MRIAELKPGSLVTLGFWTGKQCREEKAIFLSFNRDNAEVRFLSQGVSEGLYEWSAYYYRGRLSYGTGADRLQVLDAKEVLS